MIKDFTINLLYHHDGQQRFDDLLQNGGLILEEFTDEEFYSILGGLELIANKHFIFFQECNYYDLSFCVSFLLNTLKALGVYHGIADTDIDSNTKEVVLVGIVPNRNELTFSIDNGFIRLSYKWTGVKSRNEFSFENITVDIQAWIDAAKAALNEYYELTERLYGLFDEMKKTSVLYTFLMDWKAFQKIN
jgi:hypothetical protein